MTDKPHAWIPAGEAAGILHVSRATLYAYVSRGYLRSQSAPGSSRERLYARDDVERLQRRSEERREPDKAAARALHWGMPILESSIAFIDGRALYYRGHDARELARTRSIRDVASLIWTGSFEAPFAAATSPERFDLARRITSLAFVPRAQSMLAAASARDPHAFDRRPEGVAIAGSKILNLMTAAAAGAARSAERPSANQEPAIETVLARAWNVTPRGADVLRSALILCADHELNVSSFTARCVASAGSHPYAVVIAGLAALEGTRHGGASVRAESTLDLMRRTPRLRAAIAERLRRGEQIDGFGHPLYRDGDPRAAALLEQLNERYGKSSELTFVREFADAATSVLREPPNVDFALAATARVLRLPAGAPLTLFAIGRTIGWIGHAIEQYATGHIIRPRAKYVGPVPAVGE